MPTTSWNYWEATMARPPTDQYWAINGQVMLDAMHRCHEGENPELMYLELIANSDTEETDDED